MNKTGKCQNEEHTKEKDAYHLHWRLVLMHSHAWKSCRDSFDAGVFCKSAYSCWDQVSMLCLGSWVPCSHVNLLVSLSWERGCFKKGNHIDMDPPSCLGLVFRSISFCLEKPTLIEFFHLGVCGTFLNPFGSNKTIRPSEGPHAPFRLEPFRLEPWAV